MSTVHQPHSSSQHEHEGSHTGSSAAKSKRRLIIVLGLTSTYLFAEVIGGVLTGSLALLADAGHMFTDVLGLSMALAAIQFAQRPATPAKTYGFYRTEILAALVNAVVLFGISAYILYEAWRRFQNPPEIASLPMLAVASGGLVVNLIGIKLLHAGSGESLNVQGAFLEVVSDLLGSIGVILAAVIIYFTGWWQADPVVSVLIGLFIIPRTWKLLKAALDVLLESTPGHIALPQVTAAIRSVPGVADVHDLHVWSITSGFIAMSAHIEASGRASDEVLRELKTVLNEQFKIEHSTLQVEQIDHSDSGACCSVDPRCLVVGSAPPPVPEKTSVM